MDAWRKSSYSGQTTNCVEIAFSADVVGVRDSKRPEAGRLTLPASSWVAFVRGRSPR